LFVKEQNGVVLSTSEDCQAAILTAKQTDKIKLIGGLIGDICQQKTEK
jgi:hypothetical protein